MSSKLKDLRIVDNFYQSSSFFPMPLTLIGTLDENGNTSFGAYSLVFPYYIAGKDYYAMVLEVRNSSNTCKGLLRNGKCTINFLPYSKKIFKEHVRLGFPGDTPEEKMKDFKFHLEDGLSSKDNPSEVYPKVISEALQVFECTWVKELDNAENDKIEDEYNGPYHDFNGITSKYGAHFILKIDHILLQEKYHKSIIDGVTKKDFCPLPTNWGYRDSKNFWCSGYKRADFEGIPDKEVDITSVKYAAERIDDVVKFSDEALKMLVKVPRPFLKLVLTGCVTWAKENNCVFITEKEMEIINEQRSKKRK
jgi:flavin reductase (DIM6/NTAB) family NADH-FMN oxidoreductase RutF